MTNDQALLASMENNTVIGIFLIVLVIWYLIYVFGKDSKPKKYIICEDEIIDEKDYIHKTKLIDILTKCYWTNNQKVYMFNQDTGKWETFSNVKEWMEQRVFNQETK